GAPTGGSDHRMMATSVMSIAVAARLIAAPLDVHYSRQTRRSTRWVSWLRTITTETGDTRPSSTRSGAGYANGKNLRLLLRSAGGKARAAFRARQRARRCPRGRHHSHQHLRSRAAIRATKEIPIVMAIVGAPVAMGLVSNLADSSSAGATCFS